MGIHPTAIISPEAVIEEDVTIGPYSVIAGQVRIGRGTKIDNNVTVGCETGCVEIGEDNHLLSGAVVGSLPQDLSYKGEKTRLEIGNNNVIREFVTINIGTAKDTGITRIGDNCLLMAYVHIAHDCVIGNGVVIANSCHFAGHVIVENDVRIGGGCLFAQFIRLGKHCYIAGDSTPNKDVLPFTIAQGKWAVMRATNKIGLDRAGYEKEEIENIHRAVRFIIKGDRTLDEAVEKISQECKPSENVEYILNFVKDSKKGLAR